MNRELFRIVRACVGAVCFILFVGHAGVAITTIQEVIPTNERVVLTVNKSHLIKLDQPALQVSVVNPEITDVQIIDPQQILVSAKMVGETSLVIWKEDETTQAVDLVVKWNTREVEESIQDLLPDEAIKVVSLREGIALKGTVGKLDSVDRSMKIAMNYVPNVVNMLEVPGYQQVLLKVKVAEVARDFQEELGVDFFYTNEEIFGGNVLSGLVSGDYGDTSQFDVELTDAVTLFMGAPNDDVFAFVQALKRKGLIQILAEPNLLSRSGETATFLAGGEFPIPIIQGGLSDAVTIEFKEFGVRLNFTPTVMDNETILLDVAPEVSELDFSSGVEFGGFTIPGLVTRRAKTVVQLKDKQTFAIAGLMSQSRRMNESKVPMLGDIPMFGNLFKNKVESARETELLIMVTPHLVAPLDDAGQMKMPGEHEYPEVETMYEFRMNEMGKNQQGAAPADDISVNEIPPAAPMENSAPQPPAEKANPKRPGGNALFYR